jgi:hypothetical protein
MDTHPATAWYPADHAQDHQQHQADAEAPADQLLFDREQGFDAGLGQFFLQGRIAHGLILN